MSSYLYGGEDSRGTGIETTADADADTEADAETDTETSMSIAELTAGERKQIGPRVSANLLEASKPWGPGGKRQVIEDLLLERVMGEEYMEFERYAEMKRAEIERKKRDHEPLREKFAALPSLLEELDEIERNHTHELARDIHERRQEVKTTNELSAERERELQSELVELEKQVRAPGDVLPTRLFPGHTGVKDIAQRFSMSPTRVIEKVKERNPDVPDFAFESGLDSQYKWEGLNSSKQAKLPVDERPDEPSRDDQAGLNRRY